MPRRPGQDAAAASTVEGRAHGGRTARNRSADSGRSSAQTAGAGVRAPEQQAMPAYDDIARRAYELYQERGGNEGQDLDDWLRAEAELRGRREDEL